MDDPVCVTTLVPRTTTPRAMPAPDRGFPRTATGRISRGILPHPEAGLSATPARTSNLGWRDGRALGRVSGLECGLRGLCRSPRAWTVTPARHHAPIGIICLHD